MTTPFLREPGTVGVMVAAVASAVVAVVAGTHDHVGPGWATLLGLATGAGGAVLVACLTRRPPPPPPPPPSEFQPAPRDTA